MHIYMGTARDPSDSLFSSKSRTYVRLGTLRLRNFGLGHNRRDVAAGWTFLRSGAVTIAPITDADMAQLDGLMARYYDRPMDFADATLVHVAKRESLITILTIDHDDFETYRIGRRQRFQILPERRLFQ
jgi:hypothetical protein